MNKHIKRNCIIVPPPPTIPPHFTITYIHTYIHTLKLTRWLPRHTTCRLLSTSLRATSEGSMTKVGLAIADKSGLTRWQENVISPSPYRQGGIPYALPNRRLSANLGLVRLSDPAAFKPRDRTAVELRENKGVAANGLTNTNTNEIIPTIRWSTLMTSLDAGCDCPFPLLVMVPFRC